MPFRSDPPSDPGTLEITGLGSSLPHAWKLHPDSDIKSYCCLLAVYTNPPLIHSRRHSLCSFLFSLCLFVCFLFPIYDLAMLKLFYARCSRLLPPPTIVKPVSGWDPLSAWKHSISLGISYSCSKCLALLFVLSLPLPPHRSGWDGEFLFPVWLCFFCFPSLCSSS